MQEILKKSAIEQSNAILNKEISATELVKATLERINSIDEKLGAYNSITSDIALSRVYSIPKIPNLFAVPSVNAVVSARVDKLNLL